MPKDPNVWEIMGRNVRNIRMEKGIKAKDFAREFGVNVGTLKRMEKGKICGFSYFEIPKIEKILGAEFCEITKGIEYVND